MRDARPEGSPYPKADLTLRGLARLADFTLAWVVAHSAPQVGPLLAALYLLVADGLMNGQSVGKRIFGVRTVVVTRRAPAGWHESLLRNAPFALVAVFYAIPLLWLLVPGYGIVLCVMWLSEKEFVSIAIDAGGVATGPLANTFLLALALGTSAAAGGQDPLVDGLGLVSLIALAPLVSVMVLGLVVRWKERRKE